MPPPPTNQYKPNNARPNNLNQPTRTQQEEESARSDALPYPGPLPPAIDAAQFTALCTAPPLQGPNWNGPRRFAPLDPQSEAPRPGMLVAIDAEFVAISRAEATIGLERGGQVQLKPSRLALARVSVLRGEGPRAGEPCIDDYVRGVDPVFDYLTRYRWAFGGGGGAFGGGGAG